MRPSFSTTLVFQRTQRNAHHLYLSALRKGEWRHRHFKQFLDEQIKHGEVNNNVKHNEVSNAKH
jgi:hypothetical protein